MAKRVFSEPGMQILDSWSSAGLRRHRMTELLAVMAPEETGAAINPPSAAQELNRSQNVNSPAWKCVLDKIVGTVLMAP